MKGLLIVADSVRAHSDGTFSLVRGGVDRAEIPPDAPKPVVHRGTVLARIRGDADDEGSHRFSLVVQAETGVKLAPDLEGEVVIPKGGGSFHACLDFGFDITRVGFYTFALFVDGKQLDSWRVEVQASKAGVLLGGKK